MRNILRTILYCERDKLRCIELVEMLHRLTKLAIGKMQLAKQLPTVNCSLPTFVIAEIYPVSCIVLVLLNLLLWGCKKPEVVDKVPSIKFEAFELLDTTTDALGNPAKIYDLVFSFIDGDGNLGVQDNDTLSTDDTSRVYLTRYIKQNGVFVVDSIDEDMSSYRIPYYDPKGNNKVLKGWMRITITFYFISFSDDTLNYDFYIVDRALNKSNIEKSSDIVIP